MMGVGAFVRFDEASSYESLTMLLLLFLTGGDAVEEELEEVTLSASPTTLPGTNKILLLRFCV
jgi:hypothetical protein